MDMKLKDVARLQVTAGDTVVVRVASVLSLAQQDRVKEQVHRLLPPGVRCMVLDGDMSLSVVSTLDARRVPDLLAANTRAHNRNVVLSDAVQNAARTFRQYEALHTAKGTQEGTDKAAANRRMAEALEEALKVNTMGPVPTKTEV